MTKKQIARVVAFCMVMICMFLFLSDVFQNRTNRRSLTSTRTYYSLEKDTLDVAVLGTSGIDRYWLAAKAFEEEGIASYAFATNHFPSWFILPLAKDFSRRHDDLKLLVIDMRPFTASYTGAKLERFEERARIGSEALPVFSRTRFEAINRSLKIISENVEGASRFDLSYYFTFIKHHSRWSEDDFDLYNEIEYKTSEYMSAYMHSYFSVTTVEEPVTTVKTDKRSPIDAVCLENLYELFDYFEKQDYEVLFLNTPHSHSQLEAERINYLCDVLDKEGYKYINYDLDESIYDLKNDFYNPEHANYYGAEKFTDVFADYLLKNYELTDRRGDERYYQWEGTYANMKSSIAKWAAKRNS